MRDRTEHQMVTYWQLGIISRGALPLEGRNPGERHPRLEGCLPEPVLAGSRGRVPFLGVLVVLAGPVRRRVLVRLADAFDAVDFSDVLGDDRGDEGFPVVALKHPVSDDGAGEALAVHEGRRRDLQAVFPEQAHDEIRVRVHDVEAGYEGGHVTDPHAVNVRVRDRDDVVVVDALRVEGPFDHLVSLACGEGILPRVAVLRRADADDDFVVRLQDSLHRREVTSMERLEPTDEERPPGHSSSSERKWSMYGHSSVKNLRQWTQRPSSSDGERAGLNS